MKSKPADDVIHAYIETILPQIGLSRFILMDNRTEFNNDTMVYGREPINTELKELEELHRYTSINCGLKCLQQLNKIWKNHADQLR